MAMEDYWERVSGLISSISTLTEKPFGLLFEDPTGKVTFGSALVGV